MKPLGAWVEELLERLNFISKWVRENVAPVVWISGFYFPQAFLTGSLQNYARKHQLPIDTLDFDFVYKREPAESFKKKAEDGGYINGIFLEGARWDEEIQSINDSIPKQLYTMLPVLHLVPVQHRKAPTEGIYRLPVYKILSRRGVLATTGHSTNFVMWMEVPSNRRNIINNIGMADQDTWIKAGVGGFLSLKF
eukprot:g3222.t1